ncbi:MAG: hypothetical protein VR69_08825 [Peptococcaceae bacterium BRH_c4b]|nr:MAG: hypothetical protein VR69_08825 [Peptococcaceae bacterium BRH_c4b]
MILLTAAVISGCSPKAVPEYQNIGPQELNSILQNDKDLFLVDVREPEELLDTGYIPGAVNIPVGKVKSDFNALPKTGKLIIYCRSGRRSADVAGFLAEKGFTNVYNLEGGIIGWPYDKIMPERSNTLKSI